MTGIVRKVIVEKHFGFIESNENKRDYFFHRSDFKGNWDNMVSDVVGRDKIQVEFEPRDSIKGLRAADVRRVGKVLN